MVKRYLGLFLFLLSTCHFSLADVSLAVHVIQVALFALNRILHNNYAHFIPPSYVFDNQTPLRQDLPH